MGNEDAGGCSSSESSNEGRPFKKARYVWEVKGKYHLKPTPNEQNEDCSSSNKSNLELDADNNNKEEEIPSSSPSCPSSPPHENSKCCIESFLAKTDSIFNNVMADSDDESDSTLSKNIDQSLSNEIPITLVTPNPKNQDYYLQRWQSRQMARAYIDNTINRVLESWIVSPPFDATDFVENCDNDGQIEDEGILMAIQSHGLQRNNGLSFMKADELADSTLKDLEKKQEEIDGKKVEQQEEEEEGEKADKEECNPLPNFNIEFLDAAVCVAIKRKGLSSYKY